MCSKWELGATGLHFFTLTMKLKKGNVKKKKIPFKISSKKNKTKQNKMLRNKPDKGGERHVLRTINP